MENLTYVERPRTATRAKERLTQIIRDVCTKHQAVKKHPAAAQHGVRPTGHVVALHHMGNFAEAKALQDSLGAFASDAVLSSLPPVIGGAFRTGCTCRCHLLAMRCENVIFLCVAAKITRFTRKNWRNPCG